jgi:integrase
MDNIKTVAGRGALAVRPAPYFQSIGLGLAVGYRQGKTGGAWVARLTDPYTRKHRQKSLHLNPATPPSEQFAEAHYLTRSWRDEEQGGQTPETTTVERVCANYVESLEKSGRNKTAEDARKKHEIAFRTLPRLRHTKLDKLDPEMLEQLTPLLYAGGRNGQRKDGTVGRVLGCLRSAFFFAEKSGLLTKKQLSAIAEAIPKPPEADARDVYLTKEQREIIIEALPEYLQNVAVAMNVLGCRPGALSSRIVSDYDQVRGTLKITGDKQRKNSKSHDRVIPLNQNLKNLFDRLVADKKPNDYIFEPRPGLSKWKSDRASKDFSSAISKLNMPVGTVLYSVRHSRISDLCLSFQPIEIAKMVGTSLEQIEKTYFKTEANRMREMLDA